MIRFLLRFVGFWFLVAGFVALMVDGTRSIAASALVLTSAGDAWFALSPNGLSAVEASTRGAAPVLWDGLVAPALSAPAFLVLLALGIALMMVGRARQRSRFEAA